MGLRINPAPESFKSPAVKNIESNNDGATLTTEKIMVGVDQINSHFKKYGYYDAIRNSDLYSKGNPPDGK